MTTKHTPGPWKPIRDLSSKMVGIWADDGEGWVGEVETMADAKLIAAAPDLLAALEAIMATRFTPWREDAVKANSVASAAIAKAKGEKR